MASEPYSTNPFFLGIEGERWDDTVPGLYIPMPSLGVPETGLLVIRQGGSYAIVTRSKWATIDDLVMVSAVVHQMLEEFSVG